MPPQIPMPDADWWSDRGLAVVLVGVALSVSILCLREWWKVHRPHKLRMNELMAQREIKQGQLLDTLREDLPVKSALMAQQAKLLEKMDARGDEHNHICTNSHILLEKIAEKVLRD